jgi:isopenicillin N synthase-like dioxygenase
MAAVWTEYFRACDELAARLIRGFALGLDLPKDWFDATIDRNISMLRAIHYPDGGGGVGVVLAGSGRGAVSTGRPHSCDEVCIAN